MLELVIPSRELYDEIKEEFLIVDGQTLRLEHSLVSLSKWESKWCKPFLSDEVYSCITQDHIDAVIKYIESPMTATTIRNTDKTAKKEIITSEIIYYWMVTYNIPFECQKWHLNRLLTLINVCSIKNSPPKKMPKSEILSRNRALNEARKKQYNTRG